MLKRLAIQASFAIFSVVLVSSILLTGWSRTNASEDAFTPEATSDNPLGIVIEQSIESNRIDSQPMDSSKDESSLYEMFGDEQVFPFQP